MKISSISKLSIALVLSIMINPHITSATVGARLAKTVIIFAGGFLAGDYYAHQQQEDNPVITAWNSLKEKAGLGRASLTDKAKEIKTDGEKLVEDGKNRLRDALKK